MHCISLVPRAGHCVQLHDNGFHELVPPHATSGSSLGHNFRPDGSVPGGDGAVAYRAPCGISKCHFAAG